MSHTLNGLHLPKRKPGRLGYTVLILTALSLLAVSLSMPNPGEETGKSTVMEGFTGRSSVALVQPELANPKTATFMV
jgi:hypothetical protein